jgi:hypothetical protein
MPLPGITGGKWRVIFQVGIVLVNEIPGTFFGGEKEDCKYDKSFRHMNWPLSEEENVKTFASHVNVQQRVPLAKEDFNNQVGHILVLKVSVMFFL